MALIQANSPIDGKVLGEYKVADIDAVRRQLEQARSAAKIWSTLSVKERVKVLSNFSRILLNQIDSICALISDVTGKVQTEALLGELYPVLEIARYYEKNAQRILRCRGVTTSPFSFPGSTAEIERRPYGVVAVISPWNYPFQLSVIPMLTALFAGNSVVLKTSEFSLPVGKLIVDLFDLIKLPEGLVQWVVGDAIAGEQLIDAGPDLVFFTGSVTAGKAVMRRASQHPIPVLLELGGKDPMIVFADAQLERACAAAMYGAFSNSGQTCVSVERLYVEQTCYDKFVTMLAKASAELTTGHGATGDLGTMTTTRQFGIIEKQYHDAIAKGAKASGQLERNGNYLKPVVLWDVTHGMEIMREETFGPLLPVMPFASESDAIEMANDCAYGLNASIWSTDIAKATRVANQLQTGSWAINDVLKNIGHPGLPFGGVKQSGFGRYHGAEGLLNFAYPVSGLTCRNHSIKDANWFPYSQERYQQFKSYFDFFYGDGPLYQRVLSNWSALQTFRQYSAFYFRQRWQNLALKLPWNRD